MLAIGKEFIVTFCVDVKGQLDIVSVTSTFPAPATPHVTVTEFVPAPAVIVPPVTVHT